ncbi:hypothetical protein STCU_10467 [Strigomonas culicis]|uniref:Uncharacterized protein n=1 Tax=Strigomonas culicis TaxID=28005 RepID=S9TLJ9_9TRYP|nr:hypothetical protein STCU_10467 [Strigomonas culicis]|eukprot:EPY17679.1 hypothetical protein STCU_10467 [Strigomonas culicis]
MTSTSLLRSEHLPTTASSASFSSLGGKPLSTLSCSTGMSVRLSISYRTPIHGASSSTSSETGVEEVGRRRRSRMAGPWFLHVWM